MLEAPNTTKREATIPIEIFIPLFVAVEDALLADEVMDTEVIGMDMVVDAASMSLLTTTAVVN